MSDAKELADRLRNGPYIILPGGAIKELGLAADMIEVQAAEIARLAAQLPQPE